MITPAELKYSMGAVFYNAYAKDADRMPDEVAQQCINTACTVLKEIADGAGYAWDDADPVLITAVKKYATAELFEFKQSDAGREEKAEAVRLIKSRIKPEISTYTAASAVANPYREETIKWR